MAAEVRLKKLEELALDRSVVGLETLVDLLLCVHHELSTSPLAQEKYIMEFLQWVSKPDSPPHGSLSPKKLYFSQPKTR
uniref:Uncharacterized protein n=1 Tax=Sphaerodactylus townsendi TaxID=933632 RepID=A0ACB8FSK8_9SAUR